MTALHNSVCVCVAATGAAWHVHDTETSDDAPQCAQVCVHVCSLAVFTTPRVRAYDRRWPYSRRAGNCVICLAVTMRRLPYMSARAHHLVLSQTSATHALPSLVQVELNANSQHHALRLRPDQVQVAYLHRYRLAQKIATLRGERMAI